MQIPITNTSVTLLYSTSFLNDVEYVIEKNVLSQVQETALFISRLIKGLQNLSNSDLEVNCSWGECSFPIEDIGVVHFRALFDEESGERVYAIESLQWTFGTSRFFSSFRV